ncbi:MAG TPA: hypothetical protein VGR54_03085 [Nitrosopumilaceae archaeon]|nr:hypothetical protein [Nitrosopumilaceae archaeon]
MASSVKSKEQFSTILMQVLDSYQNITHIEKNGGSAESLRKEIQSIMNSFEGLHQVYALGTKEMPDNSDFLMDIIALMKIPFLTTLKMQMRLLSIEDVHTSPELIQDQANLTITTMNISDSIKKLKTFLTSYSIA